MVTWRGVSSWHGTAVSSLLLLIACSERPPLAPNQSNSQASNQAGPPELLILVPGVGIPRQQQDRLALIHSRVTTTDVLVARLASAPGALLQGNGPVAISLNLGKHIVLISQRAVFRGPTQISWSGKTADGQVSTDLVLTAIGLTGAIKAASETYAIEPLGDGWQAIIKLDPTKLPPEHPQIVESAKPSGETGLSNALQARVLASPQSGKSSFENPSGIWLDVLVVYTPAVAAQYADVNGLIQLGIDQANESYTNSVIDAGLWLAGTAQVSYNELNRTYDQHVAALLNGSDGLLDDVPGLRINTIADLVVLLVDDSSYCGKAATIGAVSSNAYAAVYWHCIENSNYSLAHELGHLQGARHDRVDDAASTPYAYGHGYIAPNHAWRTIMAYPNAACDIVNCPRINYWSNPRVTYPVDGQVMGTTAYEDNVTVLQATKLTIRQFLTLDNPHNFVQTNPWVANAFNNFSWSAVPQADKYVIERCIYNNGDYYYDSCFWGIGQPTGTTYSDNWPWSPRQTGTPYNCPRIAKYRVRAFNHTGLSGYFTEIGSCVF